MKIPTNRKITHEQIREAPEWIESLLSPINTFFDAIYTALNGKLTFVENIQSQIKEISFFTDSNYGCGTFTVIEFPNKIKKKAEALWLMDIKKDIDPYESIKNGVHLDWQDINGVININFISGLEKETRYILKVMVI